MFLHKRLSGFAPIGVIALAVVLETGAVAQTTASSVSATNALSTVTLALEGGELVGQEQVIRGRFTRGTNEFMFVVPRGLCAKSPHEGALVMSSRDYRYYISTRLVELPPEVPELKEALRAHIVEHYGDLNNLEEIAATVDEHEGSGFQLRQEPPGAPVRIVKLVWVRLKGGVFEFLLNADSKAVSAAQAAFDQVLLTFRSNERGKIEITVQSDKT